MLIVSADVNVWAIVRPFDNRMYDCKKCRRDVFLDRRAVCRLLGAEYDQLVVAARVLRRRRDLSESDINRLIRWAQDDHSAPVTRHDAYNGTVAYND